MSLSTPKLDPKRKQNQTAIKKPDKNLSMNNHICELLQNITDLHFKQEKVQDSANTDLDTSSSRSFKNSRHTIHSRN